MTQGETGEITATVEPTGAALSWASSNEAVATVESGLVTSIGPGVATITASIEVEGVTYSDTCEVTVESIPVSNIVFDLTNSSNWNDPELWSKQYYQDDTRVTYLEYRNEAIYLITNAEGSSSSIYADISPLNAGIEFDVDNYDYFIECEIDNRNGRDYKLELVGGSSNVALLGDGWNNVAFEINNVYTATYPLTVVNETASRLIGIQIKKGSMPLTLETDSGSIKIKIVREPKA